MTRLASLRERRLQRPEKRDTKCPEPHVRCVAQRSLSDLLHAILQMQIWAWRSVDVLLLGSPSLGVGGCEMRASACKHARIASLTERRLQGPERQRVVTRYNKTRSH